MATDAFDQPKSDWRLWVVNLSLAIAVFLIPFKQPLYVFPLDYPTVSSPFQEIWLKLSDVTIFLALVVHFMFRPASFAPRTFSLRVLTCATLGLITLDLVLLPWAVEYRMAIALAVRLVMALGLGLISAQSKKEWVFWPLAASMLLSALIGVLQYAARTNIGLTWLGEAPYLVTIPGVAVVAAENTLYLRAYGLTGHPNIMAPYLVATALLIAAFLMQGAKSQRTIWLAALGAGIASMGLALSYSRASWIDLALGGGVLVAAVFLSTYRRRLNRLVTPVIVGVFVFAMFIATQSRQIASRFGFGPFSDTSATDRSLLNQVAVEMIRTHPITGVGGNGFAIAASRAFPITSDYSKGFAWQPAHNLALLLASELGVFGGLIWIGLTLYPWIAARRIHRRRPLDIVTLGWIAVSVALAAEGLLNHFHWALPEGLALTWLVWYQIAAGLERE